MLLSQTPTRNRPYALIETADATELSSVDSAPIFDLFKTHGAVLLRGFQLDLDRFGTFTRQFCATSVVNESPGRDTLDASANIHTVDGGDAAFSLHPELSREPWKPDAAFFACLTPPAVGGETTICDGVELARHLPVEIQDALLRRRLFYVQRAWPTQLQFWLGSPEPDDSLLASPPPWCPYSFRRINGVVVRIFSRPALHKPMFTDEVAFGNFLLFARFNNGRSDFPVLDDGTPVPEDWLQTIKAIGDRLSVPITWQAGDVLMLDNSRYMHGRTAIHDTAERRIATYFGYLRDAPINPEEPINPPWRQADFHPPAQPMGVRQPPG